MAAALGRGRECQNLGGSCDQDLVSLSHRMLVNGHDVHEEVDEGKEMGAED